MELVLVYTHKTHSYSHKYCKNMAKNKNKYDYTHRNSPNNNQYLKYKKYL